jgi:5-hydroxyisourate hydrolase-like protein (transthyretin family)
MLAFILLCLSLATSVWAQGKGRVNGKILDDAGKPAQNVQIRAQRAGDPLVMEARTNDKGEWQMQNMTAGKWTFEFMKEGFDLQRMEVAVADTRNPAIDLKLTKGLRVMGSNAQLFVDARNVLDIENRLFVFQSTGDVTDEEVYATRIIAHRNTLGGGVAQSQIDLRSLDAAGAGVTNEVNLYLVRQAEARYGNGDQLFTAEEQERAFRASELFLNGAQDLIGAGRRIRLGFELSF